MSSLNAPGLRATVSPNGQNITIRGRTWSETIPVAQLPQRIAFYEGLRDRKNGAYAETYAPTVTALRKAQKLHETLYGKETA